MDARPGVDPREILGVAPGASDEEVTAAFRRLARRWHPDHTPEPGAAGRMARINAAHAALTGLAAPDRPPSRPTGGGERMRSAADALAPALRDALGTELRRELRPGETVALVAPASTWASPRTTLAVTDRRLLWLLDDAVLHRVRSLAHADLREVRVRSPRPWRRRAQLVCRDRRGRRTAFAELPALTAEAIAAHVRPRTGPVAPSSPGPPSPPGPETPRRPSAV